MNPKATKAELERQLAAIDSLLTTDGWTLFDAALKASEEASYEVAVKAESAETAKHLAAHNAIKDIRNWPHRTRAILLHRLQTEGKITPK